MEISPIMMAWLLLYSFLFGMAVGIFYDANRIIRAFLGISYSQKGLAARLDLKLPIVKRAVSLKKRSQYGVGLKAIIFFGDVFTLLVGALGIIILSYSYNNGDLRIFTVIGAILGFFVYYNTIGRLVIFVLEPLALCIKYLILSIFIIIGYPFFKFSKNIAKYIKKFVFLYSFTLEKRKEKLYNVKEEVYLLEMAKKGFLGDDLHAKK